MSEWLAFLQPCIPPIPAVDTKCEKKKPAVGNKVILNSQLVPIFERLPIPC
jgi:hypothetical protein